MSSLRWDLRLSLRRLASRPAFTLAALLCGALGIGLCTAIFSAFYAMILRPFPFAEPDSIVGIVGQNPRRAIEQRPLTKIGYEELDRQTLTSLVEVSGYLETTLTVAGTGEPERLSGAAVSASLFPMLRVEPVLGRAFRPADDEVGAEAVAVLSHDYWTRRMGADSGALGSWIEIDDQPHQVVGIMPKGFQYPIRQQIWVALAPRLEDLSAESRTVDVLARLAPGQTPKSATSELAGVGTYLSEWYLESHVDWQLEAERLRDLWVSPGMLVMSLTMVGAAIFVLLIACSNVTNLFLVQAASRGLEMSTRAALGASPGRIVRQLLGESLLVMGAAGLLGAGLALLGVRALRGLFPASNPLPYWMEFALDPPVLAFAAAVTVLAGLVAGVAPALDSARLNLVHLLKVGSDSGSQRRRLRSALVVAEVAISAVLLIGGALFVRSLFEVRKVDPGFDERGLVTLRLHLTGDQFDDPEERLRRTREIVERIEPLAGVEAVSASGLIPLAGGGSRGSIEISGQTAAEGKLPRVSWSAVSPGFFRTVGMAVERGRGFEGDEEWQRQPVAVVNQKFVERFFPQQDPLSKQFRIDRLDSPEGARWFTIVGVVSDIKDRALDRPARSTVFVPYGFGAGRGLGLMVRTEGESLALMPAIRAEVRSVDAGLPIFDLASMRELRERSTWQFQLVARMFTLFGVLALVLAATGLYGVLSYTMNQQRRQIGIRMALGAPRGDVAGHVVRHGLKLTAIGLALGLVGAFFLARVLSSFLYGIGAVDPVSFVGLSVFLLCVAALATFLPARRAMRVDAVVALRD